MTLIAQPPQIARPAPQAQAVTEPVPAGPTLHRWTPEEYVKMIDAGVFQDCRVELIDGEIFEMASQKIRMSRASVGRLV